jgi:hypothetical protein
VRSIFPLLANQGRLASSFRRSGQSCLSKVVKRNDLQRVRALANPQVTPPTPEPPAPAPAGKGNKGLGNGGENDDNPSGGLSETNNPGQNKGSKGPKGPKNHLSRHS